MIYEGRTSWGLEPWNNLGAKTGPGEQDVGSEKGDPPYSSNSHPRLIGSSCKAYHCSVVDPRVGRTCKGMTGGPNGMIPHSGQRPEARPTYRTQ